MSLTKDPFDSINRFNKSFEQLSKMLEAQTRTVEIMSIPISKISTLDTVLQKMNRIKTLQGENQLDKIFKQIKSLNNYYPTLNIDHDTKKIHLRFLIKIILEYL